MKKIHIKTFSREELVDITDQLYQEITTMHVSDGVAMLYCPHTTCAVTINEGYDPDVQLDIMKFFTELVPFKHQWLHTEGNSDAHIKSSLIGASILIPIEKGQLCLGTWQHIYLYEGDGPRERTLWLKILGKA